MKKIMFIIIGFWTLFLEKVFAIPAWIIPDDTWLPWDGVNSSNVFWKVFGWFITEFIKYIAVVAVISLMLSGIMYIVSGWEEEKVKNAKNWIIWSLVWVLLSVSAYAIVWFINKIVISN